MSQFRGTIDWPVEVKLNRGLDGAITNETKIGYVDGQAGHLNYRGYSIEQLCEHSSFEEVAYLLIFGRLPEPAEFNRFKQDLASARTIPGGVIAALRQLPQQANPMAALQLGAAALGAFDPNADASADHMADPANAVETETRNAIRIVSQLATVGAVIARLRTGAHIVAPDPELGHTANFLYMLTGERPDRLTERVMDVAMILHADHGMNASTFTGMVVHSSMSDMYSSVAAAVGSLKGPLHGGANERALAELMTIKGPEDARRYVNETLDAGRRVLGFGHRVYKAYDPRAAVFRTYAEQLCEQKHESKLFATAKAVEEAVIDRLGSKGIFPNVDFYSGIVYHELGIDARLFTVLFAVARVAGWVARILEYLPENRIFRPRAVYTGPETLTYAPIDQR